MSNPTCSCAVPKPADITLNGKNYFYGCIVCHLPIPSPMKEVGGGEESNTELRGLILKLHEGLYELLSKERASARQEENERMVTEYGYFSDSCGCCSSTSVKEEEAARKGGDKV